MRDVFKRVFEKKVQSQLTWEELARQAHIGLACWMTGLPISSPSDEELQKIAPVLNTTYEWLKYGK